MKELKQAGSTISRIVYEQQASVMSIGMLPVRTSFRKFSSLIRDLVRSLGTEVHLAIEAEEIEIDSGQMLAEMRESIYSVFSLTEMFQLACNE